MSSYMNTTDHGRNFYMLGKCKAHLEYSPEEILENYSEAIILSKKIEKNNDLIFEPHHKLVTTTYNNVKDELLTVQSLYPNAYIPDSNL